MLRLGVVAVAIALSISPALAEMRALVVGVDKYASMQQLRGSANDARDLAATLKRAGVEDVTSLIDVDATLAAFDRAWSAAVERASAGDVLFLSFSGHGIRVPEREKRTTPDGFEKGFILQPFDAKDRPNEILRDEDLYDRFALATARGLKIFFVADACHAGAATRGTDVRAGSGFRFQRFDTGSLEILPTLESEQPALGRPANPDVTVFSATDEKLTIQEVVVDDQYRGALSYAVARGLQGSGEAVDAASLREYVSPLVRLLSGNRQIPQFIVPDGALKLVAAASGEGAVIESDGAAQQTTALGEQEALLPELPTIGLSIIDAPAAQDFVGANLVTEAASLIWDAGRHQMLDANGDILVSEIAPDKVQAAVNARRVLEAIRVQIASAPQAAELTVRSEQNPDASAFFLEGDLVEFGLAPGALGYATLVDLTANGTVQLIWPVPGLDPPGGAVNEPVSVKAPVTGPFGADYLVTILSSEPLTELHRTLASLHNRIDPLAFYAALRTAARSHDLRFGISSLFSCEALRSNGQCDTMLASF
jgi:hypothetical protein